jgi:hypothetical protein
MTGQQIRTEERAAGALVAWELEGWWEPRDVPGAPEETHDLDVHAPSRTVALEVTSAGDRSLDELRRLLFTQEWEAPSLEHHWWLGFNEAPRPHVKTLMQEVPRHLKVLEAYDVQTIRDEEPLPPGTPDEAVEAARAVFAQRCSHATKLDVAAQGEAPRLFSSLGSGFTTGPEALNGIVERCAANKVAKLLVAEADERHLFVWLYAEAYSRVELVLATQGPPSAAPTLPVGIDVVWAGVGPTDPGAPELGLWRVQRGGEWEQLRAPRRLLGL